MSLRSQRGNDIYRDEYNFTYTLNGKSKDGKKLYWTCTRKKTCKSRVHTVDGSVVFRSDIHTHAANASETAAKSVVCNMVESVQSGHESTRNVIRDAVQNCSENTMAALPSRRTLARRIQRARRKLNPTPPLPVQRNGFDIPDQYTKTISGFRFLQCDSGRDDNDRILIFASDENLDLLARHRHWFADGTFKCSPAMFYQVFTIHVYIGGSILPLVYALLPDKTQVTYQRLLTEFSKLRQFNPESIVTDFEQAMINAFRFVFPSVSQSGCFYHFSQCIYRQVQQHGLQNDYSQQDDFSLFIRMLAALAFVPVTDVEEAFDNLIDAGYPDIAEPVVNYFEDNFIGRPGRRGNRRDPIFAKTLWNVNQRVADALPRTNNSVEGWHCGFQSSLQCAHPTLWKLIDQLQRENELQKLTVVQLLSGQAYKPKRTYRITEERISNVVADYGNRTFVEFLKCVARNLRF
jgi:hypothetical protein